MIKPVTVRPTGTDYLSVIHKVSDVVADLSHLNDVVVQTDLDMNITGWNPAAEVMHGRPGAMGRNIFELLSIDFLEGSVSHI